MPMIALYPRLETTLVTTNPPYLEDVGTPLKQKPLLLFIPYLFDSNPLQFLQILPKPLLLTFFNSSIYGWPHLLFPLLRFLVSLKPGVIMVPIIVSWTAYTHGLFSILPSGLCQILLQKIGPLQTHNPQCDDLDHLLSLQSEVLYPLF